LKFSAFLEKYEENKQSKSGQVGALAHVRLISGPGNDHLKQKLERMGQTFENPFIHISNWVKGEQYSLDALIQCVEEMYSIDQQKAKAIAMIADTKETINKLNSGKFTFGSMLKNDSEKKQQVVEKGLMIQELEQDVINFDTIKKILIIYLAQIAIPTYQKQSKERYIMAMGRMCISEVKNSNTVADCWHSFKQLIDTYNIKLD